MADQAGEEEEVQRVTDVVDSLEALEDPTERAKKAGQLLAAWPLQGSRLREIRQEAVVAMRGQGDSYREIARRLGISLARVQQIEAGERGRKAKPEERADG